MSISYFRNRKSKLIWIIEQPTVNFYSLKNCQYRFSNYSGWQNGTDKDFLMVNNEHTGVVVSLDKFYPNGARRVIDNIAEQISLENGKIPSENIIGEIEKPSYKGVLCDILDLKLCYCFINVSSPDDSIFEELDLIIDLDSPLYSDVRNTETIYLFRDRNSGIFYIKIERDTDGHDFETMIEWEPQSEGMEDIMEEFTSFQMGRPSCSQ